MTTDARVRIGHCSPDAPAVDVRVAGGPTLFEAVGFREASDYAAVDAGDYDVEVVPTGSDDPALAASLSFEGGTAASAVATGRVSDGSLSAMLVEDARLVVRAD
jgi:hypothetical protein